MSTRRVLIGLTAVAGLLACRTGGTTPVAGEKIAIAALQDPSGAKFGQVKISERQPGVVRVEINIDAKNSALATEGEHAIHIHEGATCAGPDFASAGDHFNPTATKHGSPESSGHHAGDLGNIEIESDKTGEKKVNTVELTLSPDQPANVVGRAVIIHAKKDDFVTQSPPGNAGERIACGVITMSAGG